MAIKKTEAGWQVDAQPGGRGGKRFRKSFQTKAEALAWEAWLKTQINQNPSWMPERRDTRKISELVELWFTHHGTELRNGASVKRKLRAMVDAMGNPTADRFTADQFARYRSERLNGGTSANTVNHEHAYLRSMFNELIRLGHWKGENPLSKVRQFKIQQQEMRDLQENEIRRLLQKLDESTNAHAGLIARICLATGARWSEAEELNVNQIKSGLIEFARTKSGKNRGIPIDDELERKIQVHADAHRSMNRIFGTAYGAFRKAVDAAAIELPKGQLSHVLRHTFASHFMRNGGNILALQRILGHASLTMTMRYAHLAPDHLQEAKKLNPLSRLTLG
jgi:integrase